jgi:glycosyltransferase involved in cell wall biosynthesis
MNRVVFVTYNYHEDRRGGGISSAISNLLLNLNGEVNYSLVSFCNATGKKRPFFFYLSLFLIFFRKHNYIYLSGIFNIQSNIIPLFLARFSKNILIVSPRGMLKESALNKSRKKLLFIRFSRFLLKKNTIFHVSDSVEEKESRRFYPNFQHVALIDFPPPRVDKFISRRKEKGRLRLLYIGRIDDVKNLYCILVCLKELSIILRKKISNNEKSIVFTIVGPKTDQKYFEECQKKITEIEKFNLITVDYVEFVHFKDLESYFFENQLFISLSKGENFGYTIIESLATGLPVVISYNSPFGKLSDYRIGSVVDINDLNEVVKELLFYYNMGNEDYQNLSRTIFNNYNRIFDKKLLVKNYKNLFKLICIF